MEPELPLRDIHLPAPIGGWPPAPGWWLLLFGIPVLALLLVWLWRFLRRETPKKLALRELESIANDRGDSEGKARRLAILLRRTALSVYPREEVAGLVGEAWLAFLDAPLQRKPVWRKGFSAGPGRMLLEAPYRREAPADLDALFALSREWIKRLPKTSGRSSPLKEALTQPSPAGRGLNQSLLKGSLPSTRKP